MKMLQRMAALLLILAVVCSLLPAVRVEAAETQGDYLTLEQAVQQVKQHMLDRNPEMLSLNVYIKDPRPLGQEQLCELFQEQIYRHTGVPTEGDYLRYSGYEVAPYATEHRQINDEHWLTLGFDFNYLETAEEDQAVTAKVREILNSLDLEGKSDYDKILAIYNYVCGNIVYDYDSAHNSGDFGMNRSMSAYAALVENKATCGGYTIALYRLLLEAGIDNRMECVAGSFNSESGESVDGHSWNKVKLGDYYYYLDATWDAGVDPADYRWFLSGSADFLCEYHYSSAEHTTKEFMRQFPMSPISYGKPMTATGSGSCGDNATWTLTEDGTLTISGTGPISDSIQGVSLWTDVNMYVKNVVIGEGITAIGAYAFWNCPQLASITIPATVTKIGQCAFENCDRLKELTIPDSVTEIGEAAFSACTAMESIRLPNGLTEIKASTFNFCNGLTSFTIPASVTTIGEGAFSNAFDPDGDVTLVVPETVTHVDRLAIAWSNVKNVIWNARIEAPADGIFYMCENLESVELTDFMKRIGSRTFTWCYNLKTVTMPAGLVEIVDENWTIFSPGLFMGCSSLESMTIPEGVTVIPQSTFANCMSLTKIELPDGVTDIGQMAFSGTGIIEIVIPASVKRIGHGAFVWSKLWKITFEGDAPVLYGDDPASGLLSGCASVNCYCPSGNDTWTDEVMRAFEGDNDKVRWATDSSAGDMGLWIFLGVFAVGAVVFLVRKKKKAE